ncbi:hypothetical protein [Klebsiella sp. WP4-W18-ESBL-05]|uniref:hypothetical protein n=1 Tax=Klebsiella sp. WP4-W18-ESBL-05 TaxID=2675713 RepID=UPI00160286A8|nr:hypothetical protein [Klebsiella sp. WP4-W18-ESBL-05]
MAWRRSHLGTINYPYAKSILQLIVQFFLLVINLFRLKQSHKALPPSPQNANLCTLFVARDPILVLTVGMLNFSAVKHTRICSCSFCFRSPFFLALLLTAGMAVYAVQFDGFAFLFMLSTGMPVKTSASACMLNPHKKGPR